MTNIDSCPVCNAPAHPGDDHGRCASCALIPDVDVNGTKYAVVGIRLSGGLIGARWKYDNAELVETISQHDLALATRRRIAHGIGSYFRAQGRYDDDGGMMPFTIDAPVEHVASAKLREAGNAVVEPLPAMLSQRELFAAQGFEIDNDRAAIDEHVAKYNAGGEFTDAFKIVEAKVGWKLPPCKHYAKRVDVLNETTLVKSDGTKEVETRVVTARAIEMRAKIPMDKRQPIPVMRSASNRAARFTERIAALFDHNPEHLNDVEMLHVAEDLMRAFATRCARFGTAGTTSDPNRLTSAMRRLRCTPGYEVCAACAGSGRDPKRRIITNDAGNDEIALCEICGGDGEVVRRAHNAYCCKCGMSVTVASLDAGCPNCSFDTLTDCDTAKEGM